MASVVSILRAVTRVRISNLRKFQTSVAMSKEQIEELKKNPYFDKYADKISKLQKAAPEEFVERVTAAEVRRKQDDSKENEFSLPTKPKSSSSSGMVKEKKLEDVMKLDLLSDKSADEIGLIWKAHFLSKDSIVAIIPVDTYKQMFTRLKQFHTFLFPLPRKNGYEFVVMQFSGNEAHFTTLINYQAFQENAPECLTLVHYTELSDKGIVLMKGDYDKNLLNIQEAQCLASQMEMFYFNPSEERKRLLETFLLRPQEFKHVDLIKQLESVTLEPSGDKQ